jgi:hypothetical protein
MSNLNAYPQGYIIKYTDLFDRQLNSCIISLGNNRFADIKSNRTFENYDEWIATLPNRANGDMGITEFSPSRTVNNGEMAYALWLIMNIR